MTLNLTLVVQIVHFFIAYAILSRFVFRPGYEALKSDENRLRQLKHAINEEQDKLAHKLEYKRKRWQHCQNYFYQHRPETEQEMQHISIESPVQSADISQEEMDRLVSQVSTSLKKDMLNG